MKSIYLFELGAVVLIAALLPSDIVTYLTPVIVYLVTWIVGKVAPGIDDKVLIGIIVPALSLAAAWIATMITPDIGFWAQVGWNLAAVFINELLVQFGAKQKVGQ